MFKKIISIFSLVLILHAPIVVPSAAVADDQESAEILVFGGTGRLGSDVVKALHAAGHSITVFSRKTSSRERLKDLDVDYVIGDVLDAATIEAALNGGKFDVLVDALGRGSASVDFFRDSATNIAVAAAKAEIQQIILHGSVGAGDSAAAFSGFSDSINKLFDAKTDGEQAVIDSGVTYTIIRNSHLIQYGTPETGNAALYEDQMTTGSVTRLGLARLTVSCILKPECMNKIYHAVDKSLEHDGEDK